MTLKRLILLFPFVLMLACSKEALIADHEADTRILMPSVENYTDSFTEKKDWDAATKWLFAMQGPSGLLESSENSNFVSLYDNALAAIYFIHLGEKERAERIFDLFHSKMQTELMTAPKGFYQFRDREGHNGSRTWMGDNAWLLLALNHYENVYGTTKYAAMQMELDTWLRSLQDVDGGLFGGLNEDGSTIPKVTEGIITAFRAVRGYDGFHQKLLTYLFAERWDEQQQILLSWPENEPYKLALDNQTLGSVIFDGFTTDLLQKAHRFKTVQELTLTGESIEGYCFDEDLDVVWLEGTAQMAVALQTAQNHEAANSILKQLEKAFILSSTHAGTHGLPYASNHGTGYGKDPLWDHADLAPALSATLWYRFAKEGLNPLGQNDGKEIPTADQFWLPVLSN